jgi:hypothetical protein
MPENDVPVVLYRSRSERYNTGYVVTSFRSHLWRFRHCWDEMPFGRLQSPLIPSDDPY